MGTDIDLETVFVWKVPSIHCLDPKHIKLNEGGSVLIFQIQQVFMYLLTVCILRVSFMVDGGLIHAKMATSSDEANVCMSHRYQGK